MDGNYNWKGKRKDLFCLYLYQDSKGIQERFWDPFFPSKKLVPSENWWKRREKEGDVAFPFRPLSSSKQHKGFLFVLCLLSPLPPFHCNFFLASKQNLSNIILISLYKQVDEIIKCWSYFLANINFSPFSYLISIISFLSFSLIPHGGCFIPLAKEIHGWCQKFYVD